MPRSSSTNVDDILDRAATQRISAEELDLLVAKTRELRAIRERELRGLQELLNELEARQNPS